MSLRDNSAGQAYRTERYSGVAIGIEPDGSTGVAGVLMAVAPTDLSSASSDFLSYTQSWYDEQGRVIESRDAAGLRTGTIYAADGSVEYTGPLNPNVADGGHSTLNADGTSSYVFQVSDFASYTQTLDNQLDTSSGNPWSGQLYTRTTDPDGHWSDAYQWNAAGGGVGTLSFTVYEDGSYTQSITSVGDVAIPSSALPSGVSIPPTLSIPAGGSETTSIAQRKSSDTPEATFDVYDAAGNLVDVYDPAVTDADPASPTYGQAVPPHTHYDYDASGNQTDQVGPGYDAATGTFDTTTFTYDENGSETSRTLPDGERETYTYNPYGQEATHTDFDGNVASYSYYSSFGGGAYTGSLHQVVYTPGSGTAPGTTSQTVSYTYDGQGRQLTVTDASGTTTDGYDAQGDLTEQQTPEGTIHYGFDPATGEHVETATSDTDTLYGYNAQGELTTVTVKMLNGIALGTPLVTSYTYYPGGALWTETLPDGEVTTYGYDDEGRLTSQTEVLNGTTLFGESLILNNDGTRHSAHETQAQPDGTTVTSDTVWTYDADQRLLGEAYTSNAATNENYTNTFTYDLAGNRITEQHTGPGDGPSENITYQYNGDDQLTGQSSTVAADSTTFTYDLNGSQLTVTANGTTTSYVYDVRNKMVAVQTNGTTTATYVYDDAGNRVQETIGGTVSLYLTDEQNPTGYAQPLEVRQGSNVAAARGSAPTITYILGDRVLGEVNASGNVAYLLTDGHGSTQQMTSSTGVVTAAFRYDAFGTALNFTAANAPTVFLFGGDAVYDPISGLYLHGDAVRGVDGFRFVEADQQNGGNNSRPITLDATLLDLANPVSFVDPSGRFGLLDTLTVLAIVATVPIVSSGVFGIAHRLGHLGSSSGGQGGYDITTQLENLRRDALAQWSTTSLGKQSADLSYLTGGTTFWRAWDINELYSDRDLISPPGIAASGTTTVEGDVYWDDEVNYFWWGVITKLRDLHNNDGSSSLPTALSRITAYRVAMWGGTDIAARKEFTEAGYFGDFSYVTGTQLNNYRAGTPYDGTVSAYFGDNSVNSGNTFIAGGNAF